jgi:nucleotide-binding universal stress UspA family protein
MKLRSILCPTDFSAFAGRALEHAAALARTHDAKLTLVHVYAFMAIFSEDAPYLPAGVPLDAETRARLLGALEAAAGPARAAGVEPDLLLLEGDPAEEILRHARTAPADLIVMGTHGRRGFDRWVLGSVAGRIVHKARCAVMAVPTPPEETRPAATPMYKEILCARELWGWEPVLDAASAIARASGSHLTVLHVVDDLRQYAATARTAHIDWADFEDLVTRDAHERLRQAVASQGAGATDDLVVTGKPYREILETAEARGADLIVMGTHGRNALERMFVGSTALHVLRQSRCPVLTVRAPDDGRHA